MADDHKVALRALLIDVATGASVTDSATLADRVMLLIEGAPDAAVWSCGGDRKCTDADSATQYC